MSERKETPKPRRQLPAIPVPILTTPTPEPQLIETPVPSTNFYSATPATSTFSNTPPPLPARPQSLIGSSHTSIISDPSFREPELVAEDKPLTWVDQSAGGWSAEPTATGWGEGGQAWEDWTAGDQNWGRDWSQKVDIDGRDEAEEANWWVKDHPARPGYGILPTNVENWLHDPDHTLYSVSAFAPDRKPRSRPSGEPTPTPSIPPPTDDEIRMAVPHPNAYYCRRDNAWVLLCWKSSSVDPPLAKTYRGPPLPDLERRRRTSSCVGDGSQPFGQINRTHHFHMYKKAVDASKLTPPFYRNEWNPRTAKQRRRQGQVFHGSNPSVSSFVDEEIEEGELLDLYVCCQCSLYCVVSDPIPGVLPVKIIEDLTQQKTVTPQVGKSPHVSAVIAWETVLM